MASRMDLEARLRALREPRGAPAPPAQPPRSPVLPPVVFVALPPPPVAKAPAKRPVSSPPRPNFATFDDARQASMKAKPAARQPLERKYSVPPPVPNPPAVDMAKVLGPAYEQAVLTAQFAIDCERQRLVHTAIDNYIRAGQALVALGRQQTAPHLQTILKSKALALLQRAEGLEAWAQRIIAENKASAQANGNAAASLPSTPSANEATLRAAIAHSQQQDEQALNEKEALVSKIKTENDELLQRLNQFVVLAKVRTRFSRVISARRARKAEEAERRMSEEADGEHDSQDISMAALDTATTTPTSPSGRTSESRSASSSPREEQKRALVNELHARIGLPEVDHLRTFKPLGESADHDRRRDALELELDDVRHEAERLRAAVQEMEETMKKAAENSREKSIKLEKQKEDEVTRLQMELEQVKSALDLERKSSGKRSSVYLDSDDDDDDDDDDEDSDPRAKETDAYQDNEIINKLRSSLLGLGYEEQSLDDDDKTRDQRRASLSRSRGSSGDRMTSVARTSLDHSSPRHSSRRMGSWGFDRDDEKHEEGDDDDGMWI